MTSGSSVGLWWVVQQYQSGLQTRSRILRFEAGRGIGLQSVNNERRLYYFNTQRKGSAGDSSRAMVAGSDNIISSPSAGASLSNSVVK